MEHYQLLGNEAVMAFHGGNYRLAATKYWESFKEIPGLRKYERWQIFHGYTSVLQEMYFKPSQDDLDHLLQVFNDKHELILYRTEAMFTLGLLAWDQRNKQQACDYYREAVRVADKASEKELRKKVMTTVVENGRPGQGERPMGTLIDEIKCRSQDNLNKLEMDVFMPLHVPPPAMDGNTVRSDGTLFPNTQCTTLYRPDLGLTHEEFIFITSAGGSSCDRCSKPANETGLKHGLKRCGKCQRAYYCSSECQVYQWKQGGHSKYCRKPGEFKSGDFVKLAGLAGRPEWNDEIVKVISLDSETSRWKTTSPDGRTDPVLIKHENLVHLRPLK
jgi:MYND finger